MSGDATAASRRRWPIYWLLNVGFLVYIAFAAAIGSNSNPRLLYLALLFAICSSPIVLLRKTNDRYAAYAIFCGIYFVSFGILDLVALTSGTGEMGSLGWISEPELLIVLGGAVFSLGYQLSAGSRRRTAFALNDWPKNTLVIAGLLLWAGGTYATWYWNIRLTVRAGEFNNNTSGLVTTILMIGRYVQPLGLLVVAYAYTINRSKALTLIMIALASYQVYLGFVSDTKGGAMLGGIMVLVTSFLVRGKIPKSWSIAALLFVFLAFPIFQAHRLIVVGERGLSNASSAANLAKAFKLSVEGQKRAEAEHAQSFFQRSSVKSAVEMIVNRTGKGVPYQHGHTLLPLATAFIPRLLWPDKLDVQTGQLVNTEFHVTGERVTYISPSYIGELYWNFGWIGAVGGMLLLGLTLGWINRLCDLSQHVSVTRLLVLGISILQLGVRFEASVATEYSVWIRSVVAILILHWLLAGGTVTRAKVSANAKARAPAQDPLLVMPRFPNLLR